MAFFNIKDQGRQAEVLLETAGDFLSSDTKAEAGYNPSHTTKTLID